MFLASSAHAQWPSLVAPLPAQGGGEKDAALLISIEDYVFLPDVPGAKENATAWLQHLVRTRGVPGTQVKWLQNNEAVAESIRKELKATVAKVKPGGMLWVVFIGHGAPSEDGTDGLLVGADAQNVMESFSARSVKRSELLAALEAGQQKASVVLLDACFSGQSSTGELLVKGSMPTLPERETQLTPKKPVLVLSAGTSRQVAGALPGKDVPAFSYLALGGLRGWADENRDGVVTAGEVVSFSRNVMGTTVTGRTQTPTLNPESAMNTAVGKAKAGEELPLVDILVWLKGGAGAPGVNAAGPQVGRLTVKTTPAGARLDLVDPKGQPFATMAPLERWRAIPGRWKVTATLDGYVTQTRDVDVPLDDVASVEVTLQKTASLEVVGTAQRPGATRLDPRTGITWVWMPGGSFEQGCVAGDAECAADEMPAVTKTVTGFWMAKTETTVKQYEACVAQGRCNAAKTGIQSIDQNCNTKQRLLDRHAGSPDVHPVNCVNWNQAKTFCEWADGRLPSATEWEYAAKSGQAVIFPWGNSPPAGKARFANVWFDPASGKKPVFTDGTYPVGSYPAGASAWGLMDMAGNVSEWTSSNDEAQKKEVRGGGWGNASDALRASFRHRNPPSVADGFGGFRCAQ